MTSPRSRHRRSLERREKLLAAAARILLRDGVHSLTLDGVALEAGTSKGGLLHHFPSKARLLEAVLGDVIARVREDLIRLAEWDTEPHGRRLRAYVGALVAPTELGNPPAVLAILLFDPVALMRWQEFSDGWLGQGSQGMDQSRADSVRVLAVGSLLTMALGVHPSSEDAWTATFQHLVRLGVQSRSVVASV